MLSYVGMMKFSSRRRLLCFNLSNFCERPKEENFCTVKPNMLSEGETKPDLIKPNFSSGLNGIVIEEVNQSKGAQLKIFYKNLSELSKLKLCVLNTSVALSTFAFYSTGTHTMIYFLLFSGGTLGISMTTQCMNQIIEKFYDKQMKRTSSRPLPKQKISVNTAKLISAGLWSSSTLLYMLSFPNAILFSNAILALYIFAYTPLKRHSNLSMHVGALVGALPALLGSYAVTGVLLQPEALLLAGYIFAWQYPHFYGILYQNKDDYKKAGFKFISNDDSKVPIAYLQMIIAMGVMSYIVYRLYKREILSSMTFAAYCVFFIHNMIPVLKFIQNPNKYSKKIRTTSYTPFMIVLLSFMIQSARKRSKVVKAN